MWPALQIDWRGAGPVPEVLHRLLNGLAWLVRLRLVPSLTLFAPLFFSAIHRLRWGEHRSGMFVEIAGQLVDGRQTVRSWHLLAEGSDGPYIPGMALQALVLRMAAGEMPSHGARPASRDLKLKAYEALFAQRTILTGQRQTTEGDAQVGVFELLLGSAWQGLPLPWQRLHDGSGRQAWVGTATVERATNWLAQLVETVFGFPAATDAQMTVPIQADIKPNASGELWTRSIGNSSFRSQLFAGTGSTDRLLAERFGPLTFGLALVWASSKLHYNVPNWKFLGVTMPGWMPPMATLISLPMVIGTVFISKLIYLW